jgi:hypothetical protein
MAGFLPAHFPLSTMIEISWSRVLIRIDARALPRAYFWAAII